VNHSCGIRGYMLRQNFSIDFQIEISEKIDAYRMAYDTAYQRSRAERMAINTPTERAIPPSRETTVGKIEDALSAFESRFNDFFWSQGFLAAMTSSDSDAAGSAPWPPLPRELQALEAEMIAQIDGILETLEGEELDRGRRYAQLRRQDIAGGAGYRYLHGYEYAFCVLESTGHQMNSLRLESVYACLGLQPVGE
jgi:hypothetical protein